MRITRYLIAAALIALLGACTIRPGPEVLAPHPELADAAPRTIRILVASDRAMVGEYAGQPSFGTSYRYYDVSVPPERPGAAIHWPGADPDPARDYVVISTGVLTRDDFLARSRAAAARGAVAGSTAGEIPLYVHGFNTRFQEALFRLARIAAEAGDGAIVAPVLYSWPSRGRILEYEADRQAALFARGTLVGLLEDLATPGQQVMLFGHSMGGFLAVEALRDLRLKGRDGVLARLDVILAAPDIDTFVFARQMETIGPLPRPIVILASPDDRALALSSRIAGGRTRLGALPASEPLVALAAKRANVQIIDISDVQADPMRHLRYIRLAELYSRQLEEAPELHLPGAYVFDALSRSLVLP